MSGPFSPFSESISVSTLQTLVGTPDCPLVIDLRRADPFAADTRMIAGSIRRVPERLHFDEPADFSRGVVISCVHGHNVSQGAAELLRIQGVRAAWLEGGIEAYAAAGGLLRQRNPAFASTERGGSLWVTRRRPKIDRIACPWLIRRFIDPLSKFLYVDPDQVIAVADEIGGVAFDIPDAPVTHRGELCSFDDLITLFGLSDPALFRLAEIVRGADTARFDLAPQAAGLAAFSFGLSARFADDHAALEHGLALYDTLYAWCRRAADETHDWTGRKDSRDAPVA